MTRMLITNARLFPAIDESVIDDGSVLVDDEFISWAGPTSQMPAIDDDIETVDAGRRFVMPGMTEGHVHLSYANAHPSQLDRQPVPVAMLDAVDNALAG